MRRKVEVSGGQECDHYVLLVLSDQELEIQWIPGWGT